jgi:uncharacterized damage-inducible protein DinB
MSTIALLRDEFTRHRDIGRKAITQASDDGLNLVHGDHNSIGVTVRHLNGFLSARFTDFLTTDGDKPWRRRDEEFERSYYPRGEIVRLYNEAWVITDATLASLSDADLPKEVRFRGQATSAEKALLSLLTHVVYHVAQLVLLARQAPAATWKPVTVTAKPAAAAATSAAGTSAATKP